MKQLSIFEPIEIPLSKGYVALVDQIDSDLLRFKWRALLSGKKKVYVSRTTGPRKKRVTLLLHRIILARILGRSLNSDECADHIDGNSLDNRRSNLRVATKAENARNRRFTGNVSGYKGVFRSHNKWRAKIDVDGKPIRLGCFETPELAYAAYCEAARELYGEFARFD